MEASHSTAMPRGQLTLGSPKSSDGVLVNQLIARCQPLDTNSVYCNLLQCDHFSNTSVIAKRGQQVVGFISAYRLPERPDTLFIWQVAVDQSERGTGLATTLLQELLSRPALAQIEFLETTITQDNAASWRLFERYAERLGCPIGSAEYYQSENHFQGEHDSEWLVCIGPFELTQ